MQTSPHSSPARTPIKGPYVTKKAQKTGTANKLISSTVTWSCATSIGRKTVKKLK